MWECVPTYIFLHDNIVANVMWHARIASYAIPLHKLWITQAFLTLCLNLSFLFIVTFSAIFGQNRELPVVGGGGKSSSEENNSLTPSHWQLSHMPCQRYEHRYLWEIVMRSQITRLSGLARGFKEETDIYAHWFHVTVSIDYLKLGQHESPCLRLRKGHRSYTLANQLASWQHTWSGNFRYILYIIISKYLRGIFQPSCKNTSECLRYPYVFLCVRIDSRGHQTFHRNSVYSGTNSWRPLATFQVTD